MLQEGEEKGGRLKWEKGGDWLDFPEGQKAERSTIRK